MCLCARAVGKLLSMCGSSCLPGGGSNTELALHCLHYCQGNTMVILVVFFFSSSFINSSTIHSFHHFQQSSIHHNLLPCIIIHQLILLIISFFIPFFFSVLPWHSYPDNSPQNHCMPHLSVLYLLHPSLLCRPHWRCCCSHSLHLQETTTTLVNLWPLTSL